MEMDQLTMESKTLSSHDQIYQLSRSPIVIVLDSSCEMIIAMFAALKSGRGFLPIEPATPIERIKHILQECESDTLITNTQYFHKFLDLKINKLIDITKHLSETQNISHVPVSNELSNPMAYVIYTSGSTGQPKGVPITQANLMPLMLWQKKHFNIGRHTRMVQTLSLSFDFGVQEVFTALLFGASIFIPNKEVKASPDQFINFLRKKAITMLYTTPSYLSRLCEYGAIENLKVILVGGEIFTKSLINKMKSVLSKDCVVFNGYGPTEASINATMYKVDLTKPLDTEIKSVPIGVPSANNKVYLLDKEGWLAPKGSLGEIYIGGTGVSEGYLNRPTMNKEYFVHNKCLGLQKLYRTGDYAYMHFDGVIEYMCRKDNLVKIRGHRVELSEIETIISQQIDLKDIVVRVFDLSFRQVLAAFYTHPQNTYEKKTFLECLVKLLPRYMVPDFFIKIDQLPLNKNSKLDEAQLKQILNSAIAKIKINTGGTTHIMEQVQEVIQNVLQTKVELHDNLFEIGFDSIILPSVHKRLEEQLNVSFSMVDIFKYSTIYQLSDYFMKLREKVSNMETYDTGSYIDIAQQRSEIRKKRMDQQRLLRTHKSTFNKEMI